MWIRPIKPIKMTNDEKNKAIKVIVLLDKAKTIANKTGKNISIDLKKFRDAYSRFEVR